MKSFNFRLVICTGIGIAVLFVGLPLVLANLNCPECENETDCDCLCKEVSCMTYWDIAIGDYSCLHFQPKQCSGIKLYVKNGHADKSCDLDPMHVMGEVFKGTNCGPFECSSCLGGDPKGWESGCGKGVKVDEFVLQLCLDKEVEE